MQPQHSHASAELSDVPIPTEACHNLRLIQVQLDVDLVRSQVKSLTGNTNVQHFQYENHAQGIVQQTWQRASLSIYNSREAESYHHSQ
jgi:hypothetical protein